VPFWYHNFSYKSNRFYFLKMEDHYAVFLHMNECLNERKDRKINIFEVEGMLIRVECQRK
jgi:hypothetical protein